MPINLFMVIFSSIPEFFFTFLMMLVLSGNKERLKLKLGNVVRIIVAIGLMVIATCIVRPLSLDLMMNLALHMIVYVAVLAAVYWIRIDISLLSVGLSCAYLYTIENSFIPLVITYLSKGLDNFYQSTSTMLICSLIVRGLQLITVIALYKRDVLFEIVREERKHSIIFTASIFTMIFTENFFTYIYLMYFERFSFNVQILYSIGLLLFMFSFYMAMFSFTDILIKKLLKDVVARDKQHKDVVARDKQHKINTAVELKKAKDQNDRKLQSLCDMLESEKDIGKAIISLKQYINTDA